MYGRLEEGCHGNDIVVSSGRVIITSLEEQCRLPLLCSLKKDWGERRRTSPDGKPQILIPHKQAMSSCDIPACLYAKQKRRSTSTDVKNRVPSSEPSSEPSSKGGISNNILDPARIVE
jgi:hypothetical protein